MNLSRWPKFSNFKTWWCNFDVYQSEGTRNSHFFPCPHQRKGKEMYLGSRRLKPFRISCPNPECATDKEHFGKHVLAEHLCGSNAGPQACVHPESTACWLQVLLSSLASFTHIPAPLLPLAKVGTAFHSPRRRHPTLNHSPRCDQTGTRGFQMHTSHLFISTLEIFQ